MPGEPFEQLLLGGILNAIIIALLAEWNPRAAWLYVLVSMLLVLFAFRNTFFPRLRVITG